MAYILQNEFIVALTAIYLFIFFLSVSRRMNFILNDTGTASCILVLNISFPWIHFC